MTTKHNVPSNPDPDSSFWNFRVLTCLAVVRFGFRYSNFEF